MTGSKVCFASAAIVIALAANAAAQTCLPYHASGPVKVDHDNQVIRNLVITAANGPGIDVNGYTGVRILNVVIHHKRGAGISISDSGSATIANADIVFDGAPTRGPNPGPNNNNIDCYNSPNLTVRNVRLTRGSSGIYMDRCPGAKLSLIEGHDQRGPFPRGELVQWDNSDNGLLQDFSNENPLVASWPEDNVNVYHSNNIVIRRGLLDGNNSLTGDGVMADQGSGNVVVQDVDTVRQMNGCFGAWGPGGGNVTFRNTRCRDTICKSVRGVPASGGLAWSFDPTRTGATYRIVNGTYFNLCNPDNIVWDESMVSFKQVSHQNFAPRKPVRVKLCKYGY
jgi:hypothetical protein